MLTYALLAIITLILCLLAKRLGHWLDVVDRPDGARKIHRQETPLVGGIAVMLPVAAMAIVQSFTSDFAPLLGILSVAIGGFLLLGLLDDRRHLKPAMRLGISVVACLAFVWAVPALDVTFLKFSFLPNAIFFETTAYLLPFFTISALFTVLCLVGLQNAINMVDGENGLAIGLSILWVGLLLVVAPAHLVPLLIVFLLSLLIVLGFNLAGRLFLGDSGTYAIAITIGLTAIYVYKVGFTRVPADMIMLWFLIPVVDTLRLMMVRALSGSSPLRSDRNHLHHRIQRLLSWPWTVVVYLAMVGIPCLLAMMYPEITLIWIVIALSAYGIVMGMSYKGARQGSAPTRVSISL
ncbi:MAG: MraY family glycosyltransferase [Proteobacteria bacterium]|nr:MraY family glycosyltransferase [Pseudomonadota bacterium]